MEKTCNSSTQEAEAGALRLSKASLGYTVRPTMNLILVTLLYLLILLYLTAPHIFISPGYISKGQASIL